MKNDSIGALLTIFLLMGSAPGGAPSIPGDGGSQVTSEPEDFIKAHNAVQVIADVPRYGGSRLCEWYPVRSVYSPSMDQTSVTYFIVYPGQGINGDIEAIAELYNPENTSYNNKTYDHLTLEFARLTTAELSLVSQYNMTYTFPRAPTLGSMYLGYICIEVFLEKE